MFKFAIRIIYRNMPFKYFPMITEHLAYIATSHTNFILKSTENFFLNNRSVHSFGRATRRSINVRSRSHEDHIFYKVKSTHAVAARRKNTRGLINDCERVFAVEVIIPSALILKILEIPASPRDVIITRVDN